MNFLHHDTNRNQKLKPYAQPDGLMQILDKRMVRGIGCQKVKNG